MNTYDEEWWIIFLLHFFFFWFDNIFLCRWKLWGLYRLGSFAREARRHVWRFHVRSSLPFSFPLFRLVHLRGTPTQSSERVRLEREPLPKVQAGVGECALADAASLHSGHFLFLFFFFPTYLLSFVILKAFCLGSRSLGSEEKKKTLALTLIFRKVDFLSRLALGLHVVTSERSLGLGGRQ